MGIGVWRKSSNFNDLIFFIPCVLKLKVISFLGWIIVIDDVLASLMPLLINFSNEWLHAHPIERIILGKFIYSKFHLAHLPIGNLKIEPLS